MYETIRIVKKLKPKYVIWENVKNLISDTHRHNFRQYLQSLNNMGYNSHYQVLNAKDFGIPQNRPRIFVVSIREDEDMDDDLFVFPRPTQLKLKLHDLLEDNVDEKYYLSDRMIKYIATSNEKWTGNNKKSLINKDIASTINTGEGSRRCDASNYISKDVGENYNLKDNSDNTALRIRRLTPKECWRLMGFLDEEFEKAEQVNSDTQLYKQAGNSIVVNVLMEIFKYLF